MTTPQDFSQGARFIRPDIVGRLLVERVTSLDDAELERVFEHAALPVFCIEHTQRCRELGLRVDELEPLNTHDRRYLSVYFTTDNAAFVDGNKLHESAMILARAKDIISEHGIQPERADSRRLPALFDTNGNRVGFVAVTTSLPEELNSLHQKPHSLAFQLDLSGLEPEVAYETAVSSLDHLSRTLMNEGFEHHPGLSIKGASSVVKDGRVDMLAALADSRVYRVEESFDLPTGPQFCYAVTNGEFVPGYGTDRGEVLIVDGLGGFVDGFENEYTVRQDMLSSLKREEAALLSNAAEGDLDAINAIKATWEDETDLEP